ncbi:hypothetical protein [Nostoc sp.]|uniref:hypothetical protein n=1 Tax=Nostoc sp. TaxID=1180 RepID=UPI002FF4ED29
MKRQTLVGMIASLTVLGVSFLPVIAQKTTASQPNSNLVNGIAETIRKEFADSDWNEIKKDITFKYTEIDLNKDGTKETLVSIQHGFPCNNRHCPVYIFQKKGSNYRFISYIFTSRGELQVAILPSHSKAWINIAAPVFTYEPREIAWRVFKFDGKKYQLTSQKLSSAPKQIVLGKNLISTFNLADFAENNQSYIGLRYYDRDLRKGLQYLGGWIVGEPKDNPTYSISQVKNINQEMLWFETLVALDSQGKVTAQVVDVLNLPRLGKSEQIGHGGSCMRSGVRDPELITIAKYEDTEYWKQITKAWRSNRSLGKFEEVSTGNIVCENPGWGV